MVVTNNVPQVSQFLQVPGFGEDWADYKDNTKALEFWSVLLFINNLMEKDKVPDNFTL